MDGKIFRYIKGYVHIFIVSPLPERFLNLCGFHKIALWGLMPKDDGYEMYLSVKDFFRLKPIVKKTNTKIQVLGRRGMPFFLQKYKTRKIYPISIGISMCCLYTLTLFVWQIQITGLDIHDENEIMTFLNKQNVQYGMLKGKVDCEKIETVIRQEYDDIVWVGASLEGTNLHIQIKENTESYQEELKSEAAADIVATKDGEVVSIVTRSGTPFVKEGDQVSKGQVLISGREERKDDAQTVTGYVEGRADGDVLIKTVNQYDDSFAYKHQEKTYTERKKIKLTMWVFKNKFVVLKGKHKFKKFDEVRKKNTVVIGKSFFLPISYEKIAYIEYENVTDSYTKAEAVELANKNYLEYKKAIEINGGKIIDQNVKIILEKETCNTKGQVIIEAPEITHAPLQAIDSFEEQKEQKDL